MQESRPRDQEKSSIRTAKEACKFGVWDVEETEKRDRRAVYIGELWS